jgi:DNA-binding transcriptional MerR regulator
MRELTISEVAERVNRVEHTVRLWDLYKKLPEELRPTRNARGWRVWTEEQVEGIKRWLIEADIRPGKSIYERPN